MNEQIHMNRNEDKPRKLPKRHCDICSKEYIEAEFNQYVKVCSCDKNYPPPNGWGFRNVISTRI